MIKINWYFFLKILILMGKTESSVHAEAMEKFCPVEQIVRIDEQSACVVLDRSVTFGMYDSVCRELMKQTSISIEPYAQYLLRDKKVSC